MFAICPECNGHQHSGFDKGYLELYDHCWDCDKANWEKGKMSLEEFELREKATMDKIA